MEESWAEKGSVKAKKDACQRCFSWHRSKSRLCDKREIWEDWDNAQLDHAVPLPGACDRLVRNFFFFFAEEGKKKLSEIWMFFFILSPKNLIQPKTSLKKCPFQLNMFTSLCCLLRKKYLPWKCLVSAAISCNNKILGRSNHAFCYQWNPTQSPVILSPIASDHHRYVVP